MTKKKRKLQEQELEQYFTKSTICKGFQRKLQKSVKFNLKIYTKYAIKDCNAL